MLGWTKKSVKTTVNGAEMLGHWGGGCCGRMVEAGTPNAAAQHQGRWKHGDIVARYTRGEVAGEALN